MAQRAQRLREALATGQPISNQTQRSFLRAEDRLAELEEREARRAARKHTQADSLARRMAGGGPR
jgi:hypothetical protein